MELTAATVDVEPGYCSEHPNQELVTARQAGYRVYGVSPATFCIDPTHTDNDRQRCRWCGGLLIVPGTPRWAVSERRAYCSANHRLKAHRARPRGDR